MPKDPELSSDNCIVSKETVIAKFANLMENKEWGELMSGQRRAVKPVLKGIIGKPLDRAGAYEEIGRDRHTLIVWEADDWVTASLHDHSTNYYYDFNTGKLTVRRLTRVAGMDGEWVADPSFESRPEDEHWAHLDYLVDLLKNNQ